MFTVLIASAYFIQNVIGLGLEPTRYGKLKSCITNTIDGVFDEDDSLLFITDESGGFLFPDTIKNPYVITNRYGLKHTENVAKLFMNEQNIVAHFRNRYDAQKALHLFSSFMKWSKKNTFLFITHYAESRRVVSETYKMMCLLHFYNIFIIAYNDYFYPTLLYVDQFAMANQCGEKFQHYIMGDCNTTYKQELPNIFRKYANCKLTVRQPNLLSEDQVRNFAITARKILFVVAERLNTSLRYSYDMIPDSSFDIYTRHVSHDSIIESSSIAFFYNDVVWLVPAPKQIPPILVLKIIFKPLMWVFVILALFLTSLVWWVFAKLFKRGTYTLWCDVFFGVYSITVLGCIQRVPVHLALRFIFISYLIYAIHIQIAFNSNLVRILTVPQYEPHIKNLEELDASNLPVLIINAVHHWIKDIETSVDLHKRIFDKMIPLPIHDYALMVQKGFVNYTMFCFHDEYNSVRLTNDTALEHFVDNSFSGSLKNLDQPIQRLADFSTFYWSSTIYYLGVLIIKGHCKILIRNINDMNIVWKAFAKHQPTFLFMTPFFIRTLWQSKPKNENVDYIKLIDLCGAVMTDHEIIELRKEFPRAKVALGYGSTEAGLVLFSQTKTKNDMEFYQEKVGSTGTVLNGLSYKASYLDNRANVLLPFASECICSSGVDPAIAYGFIYDLKYPEDPCFKCFVGCMVTKAGFFTSDGEPVYVAELDPTNQITQNTRDTCKNETKNIADLCDKLFKYSKCVARYFS
ncbi:hypothetical protein FQR65_LT14701 [Abscondita terminalis]|nr:hypothetical protein FQR65_LT14701 [Abscondita terminalis]